MLLENFIETLAPVNYQPFFVDYTMSAAPNYKHDSPELFYALSARGYISWLSTNNSQANQDKFLLTTYGAAALLTDYPQNTYDYFYQLKAEDLTLSVGEAIPTELTALKHIGEETLSCQIVQLDGSPLENGTLSQPGEVTVVLYANISQPRSGNKTVDYRIYSQPITVTFQG